MEVVTNDSSFISSEYGFANDIGRIFVEMIKALRSNVTTNSGSNGFAKIANKIRNCE